MRATTLVTLFAAALLLGGCMAGGGPDDRRESLEKVQKDDYSSDVMWMEPGADRPVTKEELADDARANPVRVEFYEDIAVAWHAPDGAARYGKHNLMAVWRVWEHTGDPEPIDGELEAGDEDEPESYETPDRSLEAPDLVVEGLEPETPRDIESPAIDLPFAVLEWRNRFKGRLTDELINSLDEAHPGCI